MHRCSRKIQPHRSTYAALVFASGLLVLLIVPGEYTNDAPGVEMVGMRSSFTFEHGWPLVYLTRQVQPAADLIEAFESALSAGEPAPVIWPHQGIPWVQGWGWSFRGELEGDPTWAYGEPEM